MAWDRNDLIAAGLIIFLVILGILIAAALLGALPSIDKFFNFQPGEPVTQTFLIPPDGKLEIQIAGRPETHSLSL
jgi:hypothetical protein